MPPPGGIQSYSAGANSVAPPPTEFRPPFVDGATGTPRPIEDMHIDELLHVVVDRNASDLHICANSEPVIREDGVLKRMNFEKFAPID